MRGDLRWLKLWLAVGWLLIATVIYLSLTPQPIEISVEEGDKIGHTLAYFSMMIWFAQLYQRSLHGLWALGFIGLGAALEFVQGWSGFRNFEYLDMAADTAGVTAGWLLGGTAMAYVLTHMERRIPD